MKLINCNREGNISADCKKKTILRSPISLKGIAIQEISVNQLKISTIIQPYATLYITCNNISIREQHT